MFYGKLEPSVSSASQGFEHSSRHPHEISGTCNWHADCFVTGMTDENYFLMLFQIVCLLMFSCGVVVLTQHPEWFGV